MYNVVKRWRCETLQINNVDVVFRMKNDFTENEKGKVSQWVVHIFSDNTSACVYIFIVHFLLKHPLI